MNTHDKIIAGIASRFMDISTLETRDSDSLDFHEICVSNLKDALEAAFMAGQLSGSTMPRFLVPIPDSRLQGILQEASK